MNNELSNFAKIIVGGTCWVITSYFFAIMAHVAPTGMYWDDGFASSLEIISVCLGMGVLFGIPVMVVSWCLD